MVYAPLGRTGVYPLQSALQTLLGDLPHREQVKAAKAMVAKLPKTNWLLRNPFVGDHKVSDAGLFDLLLHTTDRPFWSDELIEMLGQARLKLTALIQPIKYDPGRYLPPGSDAKKLAARLDFGARCRLAEELVGSMKKHVFYARRADAAPEHELDPTDPDLVPHLRSVKPTTLAAQIDRGGAVTAMIDGFEFVQRMYRSTASLVRHIDGKRTMGEVMRLTNVITTAPDVVRDLKFLVDCNQLHFSTLGVEVAGRPQRDAI
jgi:hypothetical protein